MLNIVDADNRPIESDLYINGKGEIIFIPKTPTYDRFDAESIAGTIEMDSERIKQYQKFDAVAHATLLRKQADWIESKLEQLTKKRVE